MSKIVNSDPVFCRFSFVSGQKREFFKELLDLDPAF